MVVPLEGLALGLGERAALLFVVLLEFGDERLLLGPTCSRETRGGEEQRREGLRSRPRRRAQPSTQGNVPMAETLSRRLLRALGSDFISLKYGCCGGRGGCRGEAGAGCVGEAGAGCVGEAGAECGACMGRWEPTLASWPAPGRLDGFFVRASLSISR